MKKTRLPNDSQRLAIVGRTGSGKTQAAVYHLSRRNFDVMPWIIFDFKRDELINSIDRAQYLNVGVIPERPGIYIVQPRKGQEDEVEAYLWEIWERGNIGVYVDEGFMIDNDAFDTLLTQGRSLRVPMIVLAQRPVWITRFLWSEADFHQVFDLTIEDDVKTIQRNTGIDLKAKPLPEFHSWYFDVAQKHTVLLKPVPGSKESLRLIDEKLAPITRRKKI